MKIKPANSNRHELAYWFAVRSDCNQAAALPNGVTGLQMEVMSLSKHEKGTQLGGAKERRTCI